jgi:hypothetical protein
MNSFRKQIDQHSALQETSNRQRLRLVCHHKGNLCTTGIAFRPCTYSHLCCASIPTPILWMLAVFTCGTGATAPPGAASVTPGAPS